jgi:GGDEF domain-containing protein
MTSLSIGACMIDDDANQWEHWYAQADDALYRAKRLGGDCVEWRA